MKPGVNWEFRSRTKASSGQDRVDRTGAQTVSEPGELARDAAVIRCRCRVGTVVGVTIR